MPIQKPVVTPNGTAKYHEVISVTSDRENNRFTVALNNYSDEQGAFGQKLVWQDYVSIENLPTNHSSVLELFSEIEASLVTKEGQYSGGTVTAYGAEVDLQVLKDRKWAAFKVEREQRENAGFEFPGIGIFDSDPESRSRILGAVSAALIASTKGVPFTMDWTLADNSVVTLDAETMINVGLMAMQHINVLHGQSRVIFNRVAASPDVEDLNSLTWESAQLPYTPAEPAPEAPEGEAE